MLYTTTAHGRYRAVAPALTKAVTDLGSGYWVIAPLDTDRGFTVLVNRGFVPEDHRRGRIYLPQDDLRRFGVCDADLAAEHASPSLRALLAFETARARKLLDAGPPLVASMRGAAKLAVAGFVAGGRAALHAITAADFDVLPGPPKPTKPRTAREAIGVLLTREAAS